MAGYRVYYGVASRSYTNMTDVGNATTNRITGLVAGVNYYFAVSAYNTAGAESDFSDEATYLVPEVLANQTPTISAIAPQSTLQNSALSISFVVSDPETPPDSLTLTASSSNPQLVPQSAISFGGTGSNKTATILPAFNQAGTASITLSVSDSSLSSSSTFSLTVNPLNSLPWISVLPSQSVYEDTSTPLIPFAIGDAETGAANLVVTTTSSNPVLVPLGNILLGGSGSNRTIQILPASNQSGTATVTLTVSDGSAAASSSFVVTVNPINDPPSISTVTAQTVNEDTALQFSVTIGDAESPATSLVLSATSSNPALVPMSAITFGGTGSNRTVNIVPAANQSGTATITLLVSDGNLSAYSSFLLTVNPVNDAPTLSAFKNLTIPRSGSAGPVSFLVEDVETPASNLVVTASSSNPYLLTTNGISFGGSGSNRTVTIKPVRKRTGTAQVTIQVSDGSLTTSRSFQVTVGSSSFAVAASDAQFLAEDLDGSSLILSWATKTGGIYRLWYKTNLSDPAWIQAGPDIQATQDVTSWTEVNPNAAARFYRVQRIQ